MNNLHMYFSGNDVKCSRREIFEIIKRILTTDLSNQIKIIEDNLSEKLNMPFHLHEDAKSDMKKLLCKVKSKWKESHYVSAAFEKRNGKWLDTTITLKNAAKPEQTCTTSGRPIVDFDKASDRTKRRRTEEMRKTYTAAELAYATGMSFRASGSNDCAKVIQDVTFNSPTRAKKYRAAIKLSESENKKKGMDEDEALSLVIASKIKKAGYKKFREYQKRLGLPFLPSYEHILKAKSRCYPKDIIVTEISAEVKLQSLLNHTAERILLMQLEVIKNLSVDVLSNFRLILKWGCDGSSGHSQYKQKFTSCSSSDSSVFLPSLVPLQLINVDCKSGREIIWQNPRPSSPRYCRPVKMQFLHENTKSTQEEMKNIDDQIKSLELYKTILNGMSINVNYELIFSMVDGKVVNAITETTSSMRCHLCNATSKDFNDIDAMIDRQINTDNLRFGISSLHAWIRFFEFFLHIGYKLETAKWQSRKKDEKEIIARRKKNIQQGFQDKLALLVDFPKQGFGSTNDGNTARTFFHNTKVSAAILGVDAALMEKCHVILQVLASGFHVDVDKFRQYCIGIARDFVALYPWYNMPTAIHKILIHGHAIVQWAPLPIGLLSEDAQESRNKDLRNYRQDYARKTSREETMRDTFQRLLVTSDPFITSLEKVLPKRSKKLSAEALALLMCPEVDPNKYEVHVDEEVEEEEENEEDEEDEEDEEEEDEDDSSDDDDP